MISNNNSKVILVIYVTALSMGLAYGSHAPLLPVFARDVLEADYTDLGLIGMANYMPYAFFPFLVGILLDRMSRLVVLLVGVSMATASIALLVLVDSIPMLLILRAISGIAHAFFWPSAEAMISSMDGRGVKGISRFTMSWVIGYMLGPLIGSYLFQFGYPQLFLYSSFMVIPSLAAIMLFIRVDTGRNAEHASIRGVKGILKDRVLLLAMIMYYSASFAIVLSILPGYMNDSSIDGHSIGMLFFIFGIARLATLALVHKVDGNKGIVVANTAIALAMLNAYMLTTFYSFTLSMLAFGLAFSIYFPVTLSMVTRGIPSNLIGSAVGLYETIFGIGWASAPLASGLVADLAGIETPYLLMFIIGSVLTSLYIIRYWVKGSYL